MNRYAPKKTVKTGGLAIPGYGFGGGDANRCVVCIHNHDSVAVVRPVTNSGKAQKSYISKNVLRPLVKSSADVHFLFFLEVWVSPLFFYESRTYLMGHLTTTTQQRNNFFGLNHISIDK